MSNLIKQYHINKLANSEHIEIHWDIFNMCNYHCSYCYMRSGSEWNKIANWEIQKELILKLANTEISVHVKLIGGEPTLHPHFFEFVQKLHNSLHIVRTQANSITIISNNSNSQLRLVDSVVCKDINLILTYHAEEADVELFVKNTLSLKECNFKSIQVSIMAHFNKHHHKKFEILIDTLKEHNIDFTLAYITIDSKLAKLNDDYFSSLNKLVDQQDKHYYFEYTNHIEKYSGLQLRDAIKQRKTQFKGWDCQLNEYHISIYNQITRRCIGKIYNIEHIIKNNNDYTVTCPNDICSHDCFLGFVKTKK